MAAERKIPRRPRPLYIRYWDDAADVIRDIWHPETELATAAVEKSGQLTEVGKFQDMEMAEMGQFIGVYGLKMSPYPDALPPEGVLAIRTFRQRRQRK